MAVRFDASGESLYNSGITSGAFTLMAWCYLSADRNTYTDLLAVNGWQVIETDADGTTLALWDGTMRIGSALSVGVWYHLTITCSNVASGSGTTKVYLNGVLDITGTGNVNTTGNFSLGENFSGEWLNGRIAYAKAWQAELTQAEIQAEIYTIRPVRTDSLWGWWPLFPGSGERTRDYSGFGRTWTEAGTLTDEDPPPIGWGAPSLTMPYTAAGGTTYDDAVSLGKSLAISPGSNLVIDSAMSLGRTLGISDGSQGDLQAGITVNRNDAVTLANNLTMEMAVSLAKALGMSLAGGLEIADAISLARSMGVVLDNNITKEDALTLVKTLALASSGQMDGIGSMALAKALGISQAAQADLQALLTLGRSAAIVLDGALAGSTYDVSLTLAKALALASSSQLDGTGSMALAKALGISQAAQADLQAVFILGRSAALVLLGETAAVFIGTVELEGPERDFVLGARERDFMLGARERDFMLGARERDFVLGARERPIS